jgi:hypothetical protein
MSGCFHALVALSPGKGAPVTHWIGAWVGPRVEKNSQPLPVLELPIIQPVAQGYTTELSRLEFTHSLP